jgi:CO/xanthine dehydrogenase FAD-binding subunit
MPPLWDALRRAAGQVGGRQIQNAGTVIGNLCNASPAADGIPCLLAMDASVELVSKAGTRMVPVRDFVLGPRATALAAGELALALHIPDCGGISRFEKLGARSYLVISIAMVAAWLRLERGVIAEARIAIGACGPRALLLPELGQALVGQDCANAVIAPEHLQALSPIDDIRAPAWYRHDAARVLVERAVRGMARQSDLAA